MRSLKLDLTPRELPDLIHDLIDEADRRCDQFYNSGEGKRFPKYVPSDPVVVYTALATLQSSGELSGDLFCEWGCGFGVATTLAATLGFEAYGIEIEEKLASQATRLASTFELSTTIMERSYLPDGYEVSEGIGGADLHRHSDNRAEATYDDLDLTTVDLFFVYPWPGEEEFFMDLFAQVADLEAILLMYHGAGEIAAYRQ